MREFIFSPEFLVYLAGACYVLGLLIINQVILRMLVLLGTFFYIVYYSVVATTPLWEAIYISILIGTANIIGIFNLLARNSRLAIPRAHRDIYSHFPGLPPGDFRTLMRHANRRIADEMVPLTSEGAPLTRLFYVISGTTIVDKNGDRFERPAGAFVGEVAYLTGQRASATTLLTPGSEFLEWSASDLRLTSGRSARFKLALEAVLSQDLARKMSTSVAPMEATWRPDLTVVQDS